MFISLRELISTKQREGSRRVLKCVIWGSWPEESELRGADSSFFQNGSMLSMATQDIAKLSKKESLI